MATGIQPTHFKRGSTPIEGYLQSPLAILSYSRRSFDHDAFHAFLSTAANSYRLGIAGEYENRTSQRLVALAFASQTQVFLVNFDEGEESAGDEDEHDEDEEFNRMLDEEAYETCRRTLASVLVSSEWTLLGFNLDRLALSIFVTLGWRMDNGVDLQSTLDVKWNCSRHSMKTYEKVMGGYEVVKFGKLDIIFENEGRDNSVLNKLAFRCWSAYLAQFCNDLDAAIPTIPKINSVPLSEWLLHSLNKIFHDAALLEEMKPNYSRMKIPENFQVQVVDGAIKMIMDEFKHRLRQGSKQEISFRLKERRYPLTALVESVTGRNLKLKLRGEYQRDRTLEVTSVSVYGKDEPTLAERLKTQIILDALRGRNALLSNLHIEEEVRPECAQSRDLARCIWQKTPIGIPDQDPHPGVDHFSFGMNDQQKLALKTLLAPPSNESESQAMLPVVVGPPGSGKTTVISAVARAMAHFGDSVWLVSQSNVAVKNIAERLLRDGFEDWRLIISRDFIEDWHEELYSHLPPRNKLTTADFDGAKTRKQLEGCKVVLCTLSLLANSRLRELGFMRYVPISTVVVDEASQIEIGNYIPLLSNYSTIRKLCFFGDDKQLAPFGAEQITQLESIFEVAHIRQHAVFLDTQYRMPSGIAEFISREVYGGELKSIPPSGKRGACKFMDVSKGSERMISRSWTNRLEAYAVKHAVVKALNAGLADYVIITPYEAQKRMIEECLKQSSKELPWQDRVFTIDSYQGNEADLVIISVVRTDGIGFLENERRLNVMLTRCKRGMWIICNMKFLLDEKCANTLLGRLATEWMGSGENAYHEGSPGGKFCPTEEDIKNDHPPRKVGVKMQGKRPPLPSMEALETWNAERKKKAAELQRQGTRNTGSRTKAAGGSIANASTSNSNKAAAGRTRGRGSQRGGGNNSASGSRRAATPRDDELYGWGQGDDWASATASGNGGWGGEVAVDSGWGETQTPAPTNQESDNNGGWGSGGNIPSATTAAADEWPTPSMTPSQSTSSSSNIANGQSKGKRKAKQSQNGQRTGGNDNTAASGSGSRSGSRRPPTPIDEERTTWDPGAEWASGPISSGRGETPSEENKNDGWGATGSTPSATARDWPSLAAPSPCSPTQGGGNDGWGSNRGDVSPNGDEARSGSNPNSGSNSGRNTPWTRSSSSMSMRSRGTSASGFTDGQGGNNYNGGRGRGDAGGGGGAWGRGNFRGNDNFSNGGTRGCFPINERGRARGKASRSRGGLTPSSSGTRATTPAVVEIGEEWGGGDDWANVANSNGGGWGGWDDNQKVDDWSTEPGPSSSGGW